MAGPQRETVLTPGLPVSLLRSPGPLPLCIAGAAPTRNPPGITGHPGIRRTLSLLLARFWWPSLADNIRDYVEACATCSHAGTLTLKPTGLLELLPMSSHPWSHVAINFLVDLLPSDGTIQDGQHLGPGGALLLGIGRGTVTPLSACPLVTPVAQ